MREFIAIVEAKAMPQVDPAAQAQAIYDKTVAVAKVIGHALMIRQWDQRWVAELQQVIQTAKQAHDADEKEEAEFQGAGYQPRSFVVTDHIEHVTAAWWDRTIKSEVENIETAAKYEYDRYQDEHPTVEQSDEMSLLQSEVELTKVIWRLGSDTNEGFLAILGALDNFVHGLQYLRDIDYTRVATRETEEFVSAIIPAIMTICRMRGAKQSA